MIVSFAIDPEALPLAELPPAIRRAAHRRLFDNWRRYGVLVFFGKDFSSSSLAEAIKGLPADLRKRWQEAVKSCRRLPAEHLHPDLSHIENSAQLAELTKELDLACFDDVRALILGLPEESESLVLDDLDLEICRFDCADQAEAFQNSARLAETEIEKGSAVNELWAQRFAPLLKLCRTVTLVDRYALKGHLERPDGQSGLRRLLTQIDGGRRRRVLTVYSASQSGYWDEQLVDAVSARVKTLNRGGLREVKLHIADDRSFSRIAHYRYLRFDRTVCHLDVGIDVLAGQNVFRTCPFNLTEQSKLSREEEQQLRHASKTFVITP